VGYWGMNIVLSSRCKLSTNEKIYINNLSNKIDCDIYGNIHMNVKEYENQYKVDARIDIDNTRIIRAESCDKSLENAAVSCIFRLRDKLEDYNLIENRRGTKEYTEEHKLLRNKVICPVVMQIEEAIEELKNSDYDFYTFINKLESGKEVPAIVYKRKTGGFGCINIAC
jgi:ribosome-associated translation inhibitor RaiA